MARRGQDAYETIFAKGHSEMVRPNMFAAIPDSPETWLHPLSKGRGASKRPRLFVLRFESPQGQRMVKVHPRRYRCSGRYFMGITWQLLDKVHEYVFWFEHEPYIWIIPASHLKQLWEGCGSPLSKNDQWTFNLFLLRKAFGSISSENGLA